MSDLYNDTLLRRWSLTETGQFECLLDAVDVTQISTADRTAIETKNAALHSAETDVLAYEAAQRVAEPDASVPRTVDVTNEDGSTSTVANPVWTVYDDAQTLIFGASDQIKALARVRAGLAADADQDAQDTYAADQAAIQTEWGGDVPVTILADPVPRSVTARQFKLQLQIAGLKSIVEAWIGQQDPLVQISYDNSVMFVRAEPMMATGFEQMGFSEDQIDAFFVAEIGRAHV